MAIKITKPGQTVFHGFCDRCGCEFTYELIDLKLSAVGNKVSCPTCGKDYIHPTMVQDPTLQTGIGYQWPSDSTDPCAGCVWRENLLRDRLYVGDTPCTWCNKNPYKITCDSISVKNYTTPCVNVLDSTLTSTSGCSTNTACKNCLEQEDITQGSVVQTILDCCNKATSSGSCNCDDTEGHNSCSGEHKCGSKKNCKGKH